MSTIVLMKGASVEWSVRRVVAFVKENGLEDSDFVIKSDQEPAIAFLVGEIIRRRQAKTLLEHPPVASSQVNGYIERAVQSVSGQVRVTLDALGAAEQHDMGAKIGRMFAADDTARNVAFTAYRMGSAFLRPAKIA